MLDSENFDLRLIAEVIRDSRSSNAGKFMRMKFLNVRLSVLSRSLNSEWWAPWIVLVVNYDFTQYFLRRFFLAITSLSNQILQYRCNSQRV